jgi:hypothetical protein
MDSHQLATWGIFYLATWTVASNLDAAGNQFLMILKIRVSQPPVMSCR